ncbi:MAG: hypothetical protein ACFNTA_11090 [Campylobacter sp.]
MKIKNQICPSNLTAEFEFKFELKRVLTTKKFKKEKAKETASL